MPEKTAIAKRNDEFRRKVIDSPSTTKGKCVLTAGIASQDLLVQAHILHAVKIFDDFTQDNDPYDEHDFGKITLTGTDIFFKIDYYHDDETITAGTKDLLNSYQVLTIMLASEY